MNGRKLSVREFAQQSSGVYRHLCYVAAAVTGSTGGAEDMVQQAFTIAVEKDLSYESEAQLVAGLTSVVRNCALNDLRKFARRKTHASDPSVLNTVEEGASCSYI